MSRPFWILLTALAGCTQPQSTRTLFTKTVDKHMLIRDCAISLRMTPEDVRTSCGPPDREMRRLIAGDATTQKCVAYIRRSPGATVPWLLACFGPVTVDVPVDPKCDLSENFCDMKTVERPGVRDAFVLGSLPTAQDAQEQDEE